MQLKILDVKGRDVKSHSKMICEIKVKQKTNIFQKLSISSIARVIYFCKTTDRLIPDK